MPRALDERIDAVRRFNRFYTRTIGVLAEGMLRSPLSLAEVRVLYELGHRDGAIAAALGRELGLDAGYLSRILRRFTAQGLVARAASPADARRRLLSLTARGRAVLRPLEARQRDEVMALLRPLTEGGQRALVEAMRGIEALLAPSRDAGFVLRPPLPGDLGWVVQRHGALYAAEYRYDERFEGLVARIVADYVAEHDPRRDRCWIAEKDGQRVGSVFVVKAGKRTARLRLLLVEPTARGSGIGRRLVGECVRFARQVGYRKIVLWTQSELPAARHLYAGAGFRRVASEPHAAWGREDMTSETWELDLKE